MNTEKFLYFSSSLYQYCLVSINLRLPAKAEVELCRNTESPDPGLLRVFLFVCLGVWGIGWGLGGVYFFFILFAIFKSMDTVFIQIVLIL